MADSAAHVAEGLARGGNAAVSVAEAARQLGIEPRQIERYIAAGAPVARRGRRGRGHVTMVDVSALQAWLAARAGADVPTQFLAIAGEVSELVAEAMYEAFVAIAGPHKRAMAGPLVDAWYRVTCALRERLGAASPEPNCLPEKITALRRIYDDSGNFGSNKSHRGS